MRIFGRCPVMVFAVALAIIAAWGHVANAQTVGDPSNDDVVLSVDGAITGGAATKFTRADLARLGMHKLETVTPWSDGVTLFEGPLLRDVLRHVEAEGNWLHAFALNEYQAMLPISDAFTYDIILAIRVNGRSIGVRDRGPVRIIYPWTAHPELRAEQFFARAVWQLVHLSVIVSDR